jgi:hypothetical protein
MSGKKILEQFRELFAVYQKRRIKIQIRAAFSGNEQRAPNAADTSFLPGTNGSAVSMYGIGLTAYPPVG